MNRLRLIIATAWWLTASVAFAEVRIDAGIPAANIHFRDVRVVDLSPDAAEAERVDVLIRGGVIREIAPDLEPEPDSLVINADGRWLAPGLADMHIHLDWTESDRLTDRFFAREPNGVTLRLLLAHGVTAARVCSGQPSMLELRERIEAGDTLGPRLMITGPMMTQGNIPGIIDATDPEAARRAVREQVEAGYDAIKIQAGPTREAYRAILDEAQRLGAEVHGHAPFTVPACEVVLARGQRTLEHMGGLLSMGESEDSPIPADARWPEILKRSLHQSPEKHALLGEILRSLETWVCPTLLVADRGVVSEPRLRTLAERERYAVYVTRRTIERWERDAGGPVPLYEQAGVPLEAELRAKKDLLAALHEKRAPIIAGTDAPVRPMVAGDALHRELAHYVDAGLTPTEAIRTATTAAAQFAQWPTGSVRPGAHAELILLERDPRESLEHLRAIKGVLIGDRWLDAEAIDGLKQEAADIGDQTNRADAEAQASD